MTRAELMANAEELIVAADRNLNEAADALQAVVLRGSATVGDVIDLINAQTGLAVACIDLARLK